MKEAGFFPHTSQLGSAFKGWSADAADEEAGVDADATAGDTAADASGEGEVGEEGGIDCGAGNVEEVDGLDAALDGFPPFFFVMAWCVGVLEVR